MTIIKPLDSAPSLTDIDVAWALYERGYFAESVEAAKHVYEDEGDEELRFRAVLLRSSGESEQRHYKTALKTLHLADPLLDNAKPRWKANYYCQRGYLKAKLNRDPNVIDCGVIDYEEALYCAREADDPRVESRARNNLAARYSKAHRFDEAMVEVDLAIKIANRLGEWIELGRYYDNKAQILIEDKQYTEALKYSEKALGLLEEHHSLLEARTTHGRALVALGSQYLEQDDPIDTFSGKRQASEYVTVSLDANLIRLAMDRANGNLTQAAEMLNVSHAALCKLYRNGKVSGKAMRYRGVALKARNKS